MERTVELSMLLAYYGAFLTERQRNMLSLYADADLSLSELAELEGISRQGVHDLLRRAQQQLQHMEQELSLIQRSREMARVMEALTAAIEHSGATECEKETMLIQANTLQRIWEDEYGV